MLTVPSFQERARAVIELIKAYVHAPAPADLLREQSSARWPRHRASERALVGDGSSRLFPRRSSRWSSAWSWPWTQRSILLRERARLKQALLYSRLRRVVLAIGDRLATAGLHRAARRRVLPDVEEIDALASGAAMFPITWRRSSALRRHAHARARGDDAAGHVRRSAPASTYRDAERHRGLKTGVGAAAPVSGSGTRCTGWARAADRRPRARGAARRHGVAPSSLPATFSSRVRPIRAGGRSFRSCRGLVIERGGMLSHGAIIAREFGIPSVVGVKDATRLHSPRRHDQRRRRPRRRSRS